LPQLHRGSEKLIDARGVGEDLPCDRRLWKMGPSAERLAPRRLIVVRDQYAVTPDGMRMFGALSIDVEDKACGCAWDFVTRTIRRSR